MCSPKKIKILLLLIEKLQADKSSTNSKAVCLRGLISAGQNIRRGGREGEKREAGSEGGGEGGDIPVNNGRAAPHSRERGRNFSSARLSQVRRCVTPAGQLASRRTDGCTDRQPQVETRPLMSCNAADNQPDNALIWPVSAYHLPSSSVHVCRKEKCCC